MQEFQTSTRKPETRNSFPFCLFINPILIIFLHAFLFASINTFAQPTADSAKYISPSQDIVSVYFSEPVILSDLTGWSIDVGGTIHTQGPAPAGMVLGGITGNRVDIKLLFSLPKTHIEYSDVIAGVSVDYNGSGDLRQAAAPNTPVGAFANLPAINDVIITCSMLSSVQSIGTEWSTGPCQQVNIQLKIEWNWLPIARNSIHFSNDVRVRVLWRDQSDQRINYQMTEELPVGSGKYVAVTNPIFEYPQEDVCTFSPTAYPYMLPKSGDTEQPSVFCGGGVNQQDYVIPAYRLDNEELDGNLQIEPPLGSDPTFFCVGEDIIDFIFDDATTFNCNAGVEPVRPNEDTRWMQFIYGTHITAGIPNVGLIRAPGDTVWVTDNNGDPIAFPTSSGFFEGPVVTVPAPATAPIASTYPIYHKGNFATDEEDDVFGVTLYNWGPCNQWDPFFPAVPIETYDELRLILSPPPPIVPSPDACFGSEPTSITATGTGGEIRWYDDTDIIPSNLVYTGNTYTHGETAVGVYYWWLTETKSTGGPFECTSDTTRATLTIYPIPNKPVINVSGPTDFCYNGTQSVTLTANPNEPPTVSGYQWYRNGNPITGATSNNIILKEISQSGSYTVRTEGEAPTFCPSEFSDPVFISIGTPATVEAGPSADICSNEVFYTQGTFGGGATSATWSSTGDGFFLNPTDPTTEYTPGTNDISLGTVTLRLLTNNPPGACPAVQDNMVLTIEKTPLANAGADAAICESETYHITDALASDYNSINWTIESGTGSLDNFAIIDPTYTPGAGDPGTLVTLRLTATPSGTICSEVFDEMTIAVDAPPDATVGSDQELCDNSTATLDGNFSGTDLDLNARGEWTYSDNMVFFEGFTGSPDGDQDGLEWDLDLSNTNLPSSTTSVRVLNNEMVAQRVSNGNVGYAEFSTSVININGLGNIRATVDLRSSTTSGMENDDFISIYYILNGGALTMFPINGSNNNNFGSRVAELSGISGNTLQIVLRFRNSATGEFFYFDNITIRLDDGITVPTITDPSDPNSEVTGLLQGDNVFNWTVYSENGACPPDVATYTITRDIQPEDAAAGPNQTFCEADNLTLAGNAATDGAEGTWTLESGSGAITSINDPVSTVSGLGYGSNVFRWTITSELGICADTWSEVIITRNPNPLDLSANVTITQNPVCYNNAPQFTISGTEVDVRYWLYTGGNPVAGPVQGGGNINLTPPAITATTTYTVRAVKDVTGCEIFFGDYTVNVNPEFSQAQLHDSQNICSGDATTFYVTLTGGTGPYNLTYSDGTSNFNINSYNSGVLISTGNLFATTQYNIVNVDDAVGCPADDLGAPITITVGSMPTAAILSGGSQICFGTDTSLRVNITGGAPPFTIEFDNPILGTQVTPNFITDFTLAGLAVGDHDFSILSVTDNCGNTVPVGNISGNPQTIIVNAIPDASGTTNNDPIICNNGTSNITLNSDIPGSTFSWTTEDPDGAGAADGTGILGDDIVQTLTNGNDDPIAVIYHITPYGPAPTDCPGAVVDRTVEIEPIPQANINNTIPLICNNGNVNITITSPTTPTVPANLGFDLVVTSTNDASLGGTASVDLPNQTFPLNINGTLTNRSNAPITVTFEVTPTLTGCTAGPVKQTTVLVEPVVEVTANNQTICYDDLAVIDVNSTYTTTNSILYTWVVSADAGITGESNGPPAGQPLTDNIEQTLGNTLLISQTATYTITPYATDAGGALACPGTQLDAVITVNPKPNSTPINHLPAIPTGSSTAIEMDGDVPGTTFGWRVINPGITGATNGSGLGIGDSIKQVLTNPGVTPITVTYRIAPTAATCPGDSVDVVIQIDPDVDMTVVNNAPDICSGSNTDIDISSSIAGATFSWTVDPANTVGATDGNGGPGTHTIQQNLTNTGTTPVSVVYNITPTGPAPTFITGTTQQATVTVYPIPDVVPTNREPQICSGSSSNILLDSDVSGTTFTWTATDTNGGASGSTGSISARPIGDSIYQTLTNDGTTLVTVTYSILPTGPLPTQCVGPVEPVDVIVEPTIVANISNAAPVICSGEETDITLNANVAGSSFIYNVADPKGTGATGGTGNIGDKIAQILNNTTPSPLTIAYEIIPIGPGGTACPGAAVYESVTVYPLPVTSNITGPDTVCEQTADLVFSVTHTNNSFYEWFVPATIGSPTFGGTGTDSYAVIVLAADVAALTTDSLWVQETNQYGCPGDTIYKPLTVLPYPQATDISGPDSICAYESETYSIPNNPGSTYQWFVPPGAVIITNPALSQVDITFGLISGQIRVIETTAGGCVTTHNPFNIKVNQLPTVTLSADRIAICMGDTVTFTAGPINGLNYEFFVNGLSAQTGISNIFKAGTLANNDEVTVTVTSSAGCENTSLPVVITVYDNPSVSLSSSDPDNIICEGEAVTFTAVSAGAVNYNFFRNGTSVQFGPLNFYTTTNLADGDEVYVEVLSALGCQGVSDTIVTSVNPAPVAEIIGDNTICPWDITNLVVNVTTGTGPYEVSIDNGVGTISGYNSGTDIPVSPLFSTTYLLASVTDATGCSSNAPSPNLTGSAEITVRDTVKIMTQPFDAEVCEGIDTSFTVSAIGDGLAYEWQYTDDIANPFTTIAATTPGYTGHNQPTLHVVTPNNALDGYLYRVIVTGTCPAFSLSDTVELTINYGPVTTTDPFDWTVCEGQPAGFGVDAGATTNPLFQWQLSTDNGTNWANLNDTAFYSGTKTDSLFIITTQPRFNGYQYRVIITGICSGMVTTNPGTLIVNERPEIVDQPDDVTVCENDQAQFTVDAGTTSGAIFSWQVDMNDGSGYQDILEDSVGVYLGFDTYTLTLLDPTSRFDGYRYRAIVSGDCNPPVYSQAATITVLEKAEITTQPDFSVICEDQSTVFTVNAGSTSAPNYEWQVDMDNSGTFLTIDADTAIYSGHAGASLILASVPSSYDGYIYRVIVGGVCPETIISDTAILRVRQNPEILAHPVNDTVCEGDPATFSVDAGVTTNAVYQWQVNRFGVWENIDDLSGDYNGTNLDVMTVNNTLFTSNGYRFRAIVSGTCIAPVTSDPATLVIDKLPEIIQQPVDREACEDEDVFFVVRAGLTTEPEYSWEYSSDGTNWFPAGNLPEVMDDTGDTLFIQSIPITYQDYQFRALVSGKCTPPAISDTVSVTFFVKPRIDLQPVEAITCEGVPTSFIVDAGLTTNPGYQWQYHNGTAWVTVSGSQYSGQGTSTLNVLNPISVLDSMAYRVIISGYCDPSVISDSVLLIVQESAEITVHPDDAAICEGQDTFFYVDPGITMNPAIQWYYNDGINGWLVLNADAVHTGINTGTLTLTNVPYSQNEWQYRAEVSGNCGVPVISNPAELLVYKSPEIIQQPSDTVTCELYNVEFNIDIGETEASFVQWEVNDGISGWQPVVDGGYYIGSNSERLRVFAVDSAMNGYQYRAVVTGACEPAVTSNTVSLSVNASPNIWQQPSDSTICEGDNAIFSITATGTNISYTWQVDAGSGFSDILNDNGGIYAGWDSPTLQVIGPDRTFNLNKYRVRVEGDCLPPEISDIAFLMVQNTPDVTQQPADASICEFSRATFKVTVTGLDLSYQWFESTDNGTSWSPLDDVGLYIGANSPTLNIFNVDRSLDGNQYHVEISGICGSPAVSDDVSLTVSLAPEITSYPVDTTVCVNKPATFELQAEGTGLVFTWQVNDGVSGFVNINLADPLYSGADTDILTLLNAQLNQNGYSFRSTVSGLCTPPASTQPVILIVNENPQINTQPVNKSICEDGTTTFTADASGPDLIYQWYVDRNDGNNFVTLSDDAVHTGVDTDNLLITNATYDMNGYRYRLDISSACMPVSSDIVTLTVWDNPVPSIQGDLPNFPLICGGDLLTLDGNPMGGSGNYDSHHWSGDIGPLNSVTNQVVEFQTLISGTYDLVYTVVDDHGCMGSDVVTIENDRPQAQFISDAIPSCGDLTVNFTNTSSADAESFLWDFDDGTTSTETDPSHGFDNYDPTGMVKYYNVKLIATSANNCKDTAQGIVIVYPKVDATITADTTEGCHPFDVEMQTQPGAAGYYWNYGDGNGEEGSYVTYHLYENYSSEIKVYTAALTTESFYGCIAEASIDITVHPIPQPNFEAVPLVQTYPDGTVTFTNKTQAGPWTYLWDFGDGATSTDENPVHFYEKPGNYSVMLYVSTELCSDSIGTTIIINPRAPEADFTAPVEGCSPLEVQFENKSLYATSYLWDFGDGYVSTKEHPSHTYYDAGEYTVRLQVSGPGGSDYASWTINVWQTPNIAFNWAPDSVFVKDKPVRFFNLTAGATNYFWDFGDYDEETGEMANPETNFSNEVDPQHIYLTVGWKDVKLVAWNDRCIDSLTIPQAVKVIPAGDLLFPTVFRPNPNGPSGGYVDPNDPNLDPNIANSIFFPGINQQVSEYHLYIYNRWGNLIFRSDDINIGWDGYIQGTQAAQGVYIWKVTGVYANGKPFSKAGDVTLLWKKPQ